MSDSSQISPEADQSPDLSSIKATKCSICNLTESKYTCPRCSVKTCSVACVKQHKQQTHCTGERDKTAFVGMNEYNINNLTSDISLLSDIHRGVDNISRERYSSLSSVFGGRSHVSPGGNQVQQNYTNQQLQNLPHHQRALIKAARLRGIKLTLLSNGMSRRVSNKSRVLTKNSKKGKGDQSIEWTLEIVVKSPDNINTSTDTNAGDYKFIHESLISESSLISDVVTQTLTNPPRKADLLKHNIILNLDQEFTNAQVYLLHPVGRMKRLFSLPLHISLKDALAAKEIIEFPTLIVDLHRSFGEGWDIISWENKNAVASMNGDMGPIVDGTDTVTIEERQTEKDYKTSNMDALEDNGETIK